MFGKFVTFEGLSAVGKTTLAEMMAEASEWNVYYKTPPELFRLLREEVDEKYSTKAKFFFYLAGVVQAGEEIQALRKKGINVFCDRYIWSTVSYHKALGFDGEQYVPPIIQPDVQILLVCDDEVRLERLYGRGGFTANDEVEHSTPGLEERFLKDLRSRHRFVLDNTGPLEETARAVFKLVNSS